MPQTLSTNTFTSATWIVNTDATKGTHTTLAGALTSASSGDTILLQSSVTENPTLKAGVNIVAWVGSELTPNISITGKCTMTTAGTVSISGIRLTTNSDNFLAVTGSAASVVNLENCYLNCSNNTGILFSSSSGSSGILLQSCRGDLGTTGIALYSHTASGGLNLRYCNISNSGGSSTVSNNSASSVNWYWCNTTIPISTSSTGSIGIFSTLVDTSGVNTTSVALAGSGATQIKGSFFIAGSASAVTIASGNTMSASTSSVTSTNTVAVTCAGTGSFINCFIQAGNQACFSVSGATTITNCNLSSTASSIVTGAGTVFSASNVYTNNTAIDVTTQSPYTASNDALVIKSPGSYPYTTLGQDAVILVDTSSAANTIVPMAGPVTGQKHIIKDKSGNAATAARNITITPSGKNIDGVASYVISTNYGSITIIYNGTEWSLI